MNGLPIRNRHSGDLTEPALTALTATPDHAQSATMPTSHPRWPEGAERRIWRAASSQEFRLIGAPSGQFGTHARDGSTDDVAGAVWVLNEVLIVGG